MSTRTGPIVDLYLRMALAASIASAVLVATISTNLEKWFTNTCAYWLPLVSGDMCIISIPTVSLGLGGRKCLMTGSMALSL